MDGASALPGGRCEVSSLVGASRLRRVGAKRLRRVGPSRLTRSVQKSATAASWPQLPPRNRRTMCVGRTPALPADSQDSPNYPNDSAARTESWCVSDIPLFLRAKLVSDSWWVAGSSPAWPALLRFGYGLLNIAVEWVQVGIEDCNVGTPACLAVRSVSRFVP